jgi:hypothetical protein
LGKTQPEMEKLISVRDIRPFTMTTHNNEVLDLEAYMKVGSEYLDRINKLPVHERYAYTLRSVPPNTFADLHKAECLVKYTPNEAENAKNQKLIMNSITEFTNEVSLRFRKSLRTHPVLGAHFASAHYKLAHYMPFDSEELYKVASAYGMLEALFKYAEVMLKKALPDVGKVRRAVLEFEQSYSITDSKHLAQIANLKMGLNSRETTRNKLLAKEAPKGPPTIPTPAPAPVLVSHLVVEVQEGDLKRLSENDPEAKRTKISNEPNEAPQEKFVTILDDLSGPGLEASMTKISDVRNEAPQEEFVSKLDDLSGPNFVQELIRRSNDLKSFKEKQIRIIRRLMEQSSNKGKTSAICRTEVSKNAYWTVEKLKPMLQDMQNEILSWWKDIQVDLKVIEANLSEDVLARVTWTISWA